MPINNIIPTWLQNEGVTKLLAFDFETFFSVTYTIKKMSTSLYIFDDQFKVHGVGVAYNNQPTRYFYDPIEIKEFFEEVDWEHTALLAHHTHFDALILTRHYGHKPAFYLDTLSMARPVLMNTIKKLDLDSIANHLGIGGKISGLEDTKGKYNLTDQEQLNLGKYCINDVDIMLQVFNIIKFHIPEFEMEIIDWHIRMYAEGEFIVDKDLSAKEIVEIRTRKQQTFADIRTYFPPELKESELDTLTILRSAPKFASVLEYNNIQPPMKVSPTTGLSTYAFAKNDVDFMAFTDKGKLHKQMFKARVESKSDTALNKAILLNKFSQHPPFPLYVNYWKATTGRSSGGDKLQAQNMTRGGNARKCLTAPKKQIVLSVDSSGIELRISIWLAQQQNKIDLVNNKEDLYVDMATSIYSQPTDQINKHERGIGKVAILSNTYGSGVKTFDNMLKSGSMAPPIHLPFDEVSHIHSTFRKEYKDVVLMWDKCQRFLFAIANNRDHEEEDYMGLKFENGKVWTHHGMYLNYHDLRLSKDGEFSYQGAFGVRKKIYSSLLFNNLCQHIARNVVYSQINLVKQRYKPLHSVHDETSIIIDENDFDEAQAYLMKCFRTAPDYLTGINLDAEVEWGRSAEGISYYAK